MNIYFAVGGILPTLALMARNTVKVDQDVYNNVVDHTQKTGSKIGKFFEIAATEKLERDIKKPKKFKPNYETKA